MAYNPYTAINEIYKLKGQWDSANQAGDTTKKNDAADAAQRYYDMLKNNGYEDVANQLSTSDYASSKAIRDKYYTLATSGKTKTRPYLYSLGAKYGLSNSDVDNLISYDDVSGQIAFGGKAIGTPDSVVDGTSYWSDTSVLDNAFNDYVSRSGLTRTNEQLSSQNSDEINRKINQLWGTQSSDHDELKQKYVQEYEDLKNTNPFTTDEAKTILAKYDLAGLQGRDNEAAAGAGSNGGNIDSFSAANALRQQASLVNQGQQVVLDQYQQKLDNARAILEGLGVSMQNDYAGMQNTIVLQQNEAQRLFENGETAKNNEVARESELNSSTGYVTDNQLKASSSLWNNGTLVSLGTDYQARINDVENLYKNASTESEKQTYALTLKLLEMARNDKIAATGSPEKPTYKYQSLISNPEVTLTREQIAQADRAVNAEVSANAANNASNEKVAEIGAKNNLDVIDKETNAQKELMEETQQYTTTGKVTADDNWTYRNGTIVGDKTGKPVLTQDKAQEMYDAGNTSEQVKYAADFYGITGGNNGGDVTDVTEWKTFYDSFSGKPSVQQFLSDVVKQIYDNPSGLNRDVLEDQLIDGIKNNTEQYDIDVADAKRILNRFGVDITWLNGYSDRWGFNGGKGMKQNN